MIPKDATHTSVEEALGHARAERLRALDRDLGIPEEQTERELVELAEGVQRERARLGLPERRKVLTPIALIKSR